MTAPLNTAKLGFLLPGVLNPAAAAAAGIGLGLLWLLCDDDDQGKGTVEAVPVDIPTPTVPTVAEQLAAVAQSEGQTVREPSNEAMETVKTAPEILDTPPAAISKPDQREMIRKTMSELGKRSAAARAKKKAERDNES